MLTVEEATRHVAATIRPLPPETVPLELAAGRILRQDLHADRDFPPFHRVAMDGIALNFSAIEAGQTEFVLERTQFAGQPPEPLQNPRAAIEIMTGAALPAGTDTVVRYEDIVLREDEAGRRWATVQVPPQRAGHHVHARATDRRAGELLLPAGTCLGAAALAVAATIGAATIAVARRPRVALVSTGDELVPITQTPLPHQIRRSNGLMLQAAAEAAGAATEAFHFDDDPAALRAGLPALLAGFDAVVLSGGVSKGKADFLPETLRTLGVVQLFHEVRQKPGKPLWFGQQPGGAVVFALPGNPGSSFVNFYRYVRPWLLAVPLPAGASAPPEAGPVPAVLASDFTFRPQLTHFLLCHLAPASDGRLLAHPEWPSSSGDQASLLSSNAFLELPPEPEFFPAGTVLPAWRF